MTKTILVIEDDQDILDLMSFILNDEGYRVISSAASVTIPYVRSIQPDLILLDNRLADGLGLDLCLQLKQDPVTQQYPVVMVSAANDLPHLAGESGADAYLNKPFDLEELISIVQRFLQSAT